MSGGGDVDVLDPPEAKRFRIDVPTQVVVDPSTTTLCTVSTPMTGEAPQEGQSPAAPSSASYRSSNGSVVSSSECSTKDEETDAPECDILDMISKTMLGGVFTKVDDQLPRPTTLQTSLSSSSSPTPPGSAGLSSVSSVPGAVAVAQSPAAQLFADGDWSWHRNPAAAIRSGGTNKQTPVWKYFVYNKTENLSRCIVGDCTYMLKGPHTSTLACHLKKHTKEYAEFQKLKADYSRTKSEVQQAPPKPPVDLSMGNGLARHHSSPDVSPKMAAQKPRKEHNSINDVNMLVNALRGAAAAAATPTPTTPQMPQMPNLMQNLMMGINPLQMMLAHSLPTSSSSFSSAHAAALQQAGLTVTPTGQIVQSKKWRRDERKQKELESKLALALYSSHVAFEVLHNPQWRELFEMAQPKFTLPDELNAFEQVVSSTSLRMHQSLRSLLASAKRLHLLVDVVKSPTCNATNAELPVQKMLVAAAVPSLNGPTHEIQIVLLAFRTLLANDNASEAISKGIDQVTLEYGIDSESIFRVVCSGFRNVLGDDCGSVVDKQMESFSSRLLNCLTFWMENSTYVENLRKALFAMIFSVITSSVLLQTVTKLNGGKFDLPITEPLPVLLETIVQMRECFQMKDLDGFHALSDQQWSRLMALNAVCNTFKQYLTSPMGAGGDVTTIDAVIPTIQQILITLDKDTYNLGELGAELREIIAERMGYILEEENEEFDPTFVMATALNPQLVVLLSNDQLGCAKKMLELELAKRTAQGGGKLMERRLSMGVDALLANVMKGAVGNGDPQNPLNLYGELFQQSHNEHMKEEEGRNESILNSYFDEVANSPTVDSLFAPLGRSFGNPLQAPLAYWRACSGKCPALAELASELLSLPACSPTADRVLAFGQHTSPYASFGASSSSSSTSSSSPSLTSTSSPLSSSSMTSMLMAAEQRPEKFERQLLLRFNKPLLAKLF